MTNSKITKRALLASTLALLMCVTMLVGTTFAWFTDTATTAVNKIQAGTLDVALEMWDGEKWVNAEGESLNFKTADNRTDILWEPGCTYELPKLRIVNKGDLALKYQVVISGINGDAKLNEAIKWEVGIEKGTFSGMVTEWSELGGYNSNLYLKDQTMNPVDKEFITPGVTMVRPTEFTIRGSMKETAGNEYQGLSIDGIAITVVATQASVENDSNDRYYDENATYPILNITASADPADISAKIDEVVASGSDTLTLKVADADETATAMLPLADFQKIKNLTIDLGENVVLGVSGNNRGIVLGGSTLKITGKGTIGGTDWLAACGGATLIIENEGGFIRNSVGAVTIRMASYGANVIIRNYDIGNPDDRHPLIGVGDMDSIVSPNGYTTPSKLTLENVTMNNVVYSETVGAWVAGGQGIQLYKGSLDVTTSNVTFNGSADLTAVVGPMSTDTAFLVVNNSASVTAAATLNGAAVN